MLEHRGSASSSLSSSLAKARGKGSKSGTGGDGYAGKFVWRIEAFTRLKDLLKKRKITGLCIKSRRFTVGGRDCRLIVYPRGGSHTHSSLRCSPQSLRLHKLLLASSRSSSFLCKQTVQLPTLAPLTAGAGLAGQSQPPNHLSMFLEVADSRASAADWSCFVSHRLAVVNQKSEDRTVGKESQNRYSKVSLQPCAIPDADCDRCSKRWHHM